jgi:hypothetical protein
MKIIISRRKIYRMYLRFAQVLLGLLLGHSGEAGQQLSGQGPALQLHQDNGPGIVRGEHEAAGQLLIGRSLDLHSEAFYIM